MTNVDNRAAILGELRKNWGWLLAWGIVLEIAGVIGLGYTFTVTAVTTVFIGALMIVYGVIELFQAFRHQRWSGFFLFLIGGILSVVAGGIIWWRPFVGMELLTLFMASYFLVLGAFRVVGSISTRHPGWGWSLFAGAASLVLGVLIWNRWPLSSFWVIGLFVSIDMIFAGWNYIMLSLVARRPDAPGT
ncbi:MAG TPA: HdeD family acid-resistance protein [Anaeromyxobacteraceae bacterium]|nr:HdeD family acid-resistance protein [Anaeromyxobacteraceae bacterium]